MSGPAERASGASVEPPTHLGESHATTAEIEEKFWDALKSDMTMMLGVVADGKCHPRPMTAQIEEDTKPIWFFTSKETEIVSEAARGGNAIATFTSDDNDLFATVHGRLSVDKDRATIERLWNPYVAAWFEKGKDDPKLTLLRFDPDNAEIWLDDSSFLAGIKLLLGADPKEEYKDKVAKVKLG